MSELIHWSYYAICLLILAVFARMVIYDILTSVNTVLGFRNLRRR